MKRAILTGFEPFGPYKFNPTQDVARELDGQTIGDIEVTGLALPCTYYGAFDVLSKKIDELSPDIILGTGLASRILRLRLELFGRNIMNGKYPDADGMMPQNKPIIKGGKPLYRTNAENVKLYEALYTKGIIAEISDNADAFICNSLIYLTARKIYDEQLNIKHAFIHTPWTEDYAGKVDIREKATIEKAELRKSIELILTAI